MHFKNTELSLSVVVVFCLFEVVVCFLVLVRVLFFRGECCLFVFICEYMRAIHVNVRVAPVMTMGTAPIKVLHYHYYD